MFYSTLHQIKAPNSSNIKLQKQFTASQATPSHEALWDMKFNHSFLVKSASSRCGTIVSF